LNPYSFVITFTHEVAHLIDYTQRRSLQNPHGESWKEVYKKLLFELLEAEVFPEAIRSSIERHIHSPKAASCSDPNLLKTLRQFDKNAILTLNDIPNGSKFLLSN